MLFKYVSNLSAGVHGKVRLLGQALYPLLLCSGSGGNLVTPSWVNLRSE